MANFNKTPKELVAEFTVEEIVHEELACGENVVCFDADEGMKLNVHDWLLTAKEVRKRISTMLVALEYMDEFNRLLAQENAK